VFVVINLKIYEQSDVNKYSVVDKYQWLFGSGQHTSYDYDKKKKKSFVTSPISEKVMKCQKKKKKDYSGIWNHEGS
jgi:hypothetical protein